MLLASNSRGVPATIILTLQRRTNRKSAPRTRGFQFSLAPSVRPRPSSLLARAQFPILAWARQPGARSVA